MLRGGGGDQGKSSYKEEEEKWEGMRNKIGNYVRLRGSFGNRKRDRRVFQDCSMAVIYEHTEEQKMSGKH